MTLSSPADAPLVERATLMAPVRVALGSDTAEVVDWHRETLHGGIGTTTGGVYRVRGHAADRGQTHSWSLVLKVLRSDGDSSDPSGPAYWKREVLAYQSGLLAGLPAALAAPRCLGSGEGPEGRAWLWLEEIVDGCGPHWPLSCYGTAAYHLGQFNGAYGGEKALPDVPWLSRGWLASCLAQFPVAAGALVRSLEHPLVRRVCPAPLASRLLRLLADEEAFVATLDRLPQSLCHHDAWRRNLFLRRDQEGHEQTILIDWADVGSGALGQDLAAFVFGPVHFGDADADTLHDLDAVAWSRYLAGLRDVGWTGDPAVARLGYTADVALRSRIIAFLCATAFSDGQQHADLERLWGRPIEEIAAIQARLLPFLLDRADEARSLMRAM